jgi:hypothetical protein
MSVQLFYCSGISSDVLITSIVAQPAPVQINPFPAYLVDGWQRRSVMRTRLHRQARTALPAFASQYSVTLDFVQRRAAMPHGSHRP